MTYSTSYIDAMLAPYRRSFYCVPISTIRNDLSLSNYNVFNRFIDIDITQTIIETPVFCKASVERAVHNYFDYPTVAAQRLAICLFENTWDFTAKTPDRILKYFFKDVHFDNRLGRINSTNNNVYHGGKGIIFDSNWDVLLLCTQTLQVKFYNDGSVFTDYIDYSLHIHPKVFTTEDPLCKSIIKKLLPMYITNPIEYVGTDYRTNGFFNMVKDIKIIIDDSTQFFRVPTPPNKINYTHEKINQFLIDNTEELVTDLLNATKVF